MQHRQLLESVHIIQEKNKQIQMTDKFTLDYYGHWSNICTFQTKQTGSPLEFTSIFPLNFQQYKVHKLFTQKKRRRRKVKRWNEDKRIHKVQRKTKNYLYHHLLLLLLFLHALSDELA